MTTLPLPILSGISVTGLRSTLDGSDIDPDAWLASPTLDVDVAIHFEGAPPERATEWHSGMATADVGYDNKLRRRIRRYRLANPVNGKTFMTALEPGLPDWAVWAPFPEEGDMVRDIWLALASMPDSVREATVTEAVHTAKAISRG